MRQTNVLGSGLQHLVAACIVFGLASSSHSVDIHVAANATTDGNGSGWDTPRRYLLDAIAQADIGDRVLVAQGTYFTNETNDLTLPTDHRASSFPAKEGVNLRGGFIGPNTSSIDPDTRDFVLYESVLSGDINFGGNASRDAYHVVLAVDIAPEAEEEEEQIANTIVSGFTITGGKSSGQPNATSCGTTIVAGGAGMDCRNVSDKLTVRECVFTGNVGNFGGGMRIACGSPNVVNCFFDANIAGTNGGGMYSYLDSSPRVDNCIFRGNASEHMGGGFGFQGGGNPTITNCLFVENYGGLFGGGIRCGFDVGCHVVNSTFFNNQAGCGGGMSTGRDNFDNPDRDVTLQNCLFWGNSVVNPSTACESSGKGVQISLYGPTGGTILRTVKVESCDVQGGETGVYVQTGMPLTWGSGNINVDPLFLDDSDIDGPDNRLGTADDGLTLCYDSPCLNAGESSFLPNDDADVDEDTNTTGETIPLDAAHVTRQVNLAGCVDIGAYENQSASCLGDIGGGVGPNGEVIPDGEVDGADLAIVLARWDEPGGLADLSPAACGDGIVDGEDLGILLGAWGSCSESMMGGGEGATPQELMDELALETIQEFIDWLTSFSVEDMKDWLLDALNVQ